MPTLPPSQTSPLTWSCWPLPSEKHRKCQAWEKAYNNIRDQVVVSGDNDDDYLYYYPLPYVTYTLPLSNVCNDGRRMDPGSSSSGGAVGNDPTNPSSTVYAPSSQAAMGGGQSGQQQHYRSNYPGPNPGAGAGQGMGLATAAAHTMPGTIVSSTYPPPSLAGARQVSYHTPMIYPLPTLHPTHIPVPNNDNHRARTRTGAAASTGQPAGLT